MKVKIGFCLILLILSAVAGLSAKAEVQIIITPDALQPGGSGAVKAVMTIPQGMHQSYFPGDNEYFYLKATGTGLSFGQTIYPEPVTVEEGNEWIYAGKVVLTLPFKVSSGQAVSRVVVQAEMGYNTCFDTGQCEMPEVVSRTLYLQVMPPAATSTEQAGNEQQTVQNEQPVPLTPEKTTDSLTDLQDTQSAKEEALPAQQKRIPGDVWKYLLLALLGGLVLNITPCVLPILPIRVMKIINQAKTDDSKVLTHVFVYTFGVLVSFAVMAVIFIILQQAGESVGWGLQNQNPGFVIALMCIVFTFALSLLGIFEINPPAMSQVSQATSKSGYGGSFFGGVFAFLMAISCTGPFLGLALPYALQLPPLLLLIFFLVIGLGFASPFIIIGFFKGALKFIPKPGDWMVIFKQVMGFVLLWIVYTQLKTLLALTDPDYFLRVLWFLFILGFAIWLYGRFVRYENSRITQWVFTLLPVALIVAAGFAYLPYHAQPETASHASAEGLVPSPHAPEGWYVFSEELLNGALSQGRPVFLDIGAEWCKNCKSNEKNVLFKQAVMGEFAAKNVLLLRGDFTKEDPALLAWIKMHGRAGVPFNALYTVDQPPLIFNELLSKGDITDALNRIPEKK